MAYNTEIVLTVSFYSLPPAVSFLSLFNLLYINTSFSCIDSGHGESFVTLDDDKAFVKCSIKRQQLAAVDFLSFVSSKAIIRPVV
jgi:hypothetical protein